MDTQPVPTGSEADFDTLIKELNHRIWEVRRDACEELAMRGDRKAVPHLIRSLDDGVGAVRFAAADALGKLGDKTVAPHLIRLLDNPQFGAYGPVIESLANLKSPDAVPYFIKFLRDPDARVRGLASNALMVMTRQLIVYKAKGSEEEREAAIKQWEFWWEKNKATFRIQ